MTVNRIFEAPAQPNTPAAKENLVMNEQKDTNPPADEIYREQVSVAGWQLLSDLHDLTYHQGDGESLRFEIEHYGAASVVENLRSTAERAQQIAAQAIEDLHHAETGHAWMSSVRPKRCANCGYPIDVADVDEWWICRDRLEHRWCHMIDGTAEDEDKGRASVIEEDEWTAYCEDRMRSGGPRHGDIVELTFADERRVQGRWYVPGPAPLGTPIVQEWSEDTETATAEAQIQVIGLGEDTADDLAVPSLKDLARGELYAAALKGALDDEQLAAALKELDQ